MEVVSPELLTLMEETGKGITPDVVKATQNLGGLLVVDIGDRGGGKTTKAAWLAKFYKQYEPDIRRVANVPIEDCYYVPNILKFLATKLIEEGNEKAYEIKEDGTVRIIPRKVIPPRMLAIVDETAISGLESRGSGSIYSALKSYLIALSRHLNIDMELISQMMSMVEKRGVWLADYYWLCQAKFIPQTSELDHFHYRIYDANYHKTQTYNMDVLDVKENIFGTFDSWDIPNYDDLAEEFRVVFNIGEDDFQFYRDVRDGKQHVPAQPVSVDEFNILEKKWLRAPSGRYPGDTFLMDGKRYEVLQRDWNFDKGAYQYRAREIPNTFPVGDADEGVEGQSA